MAARSLHGRRRVPGAARSRSAQIRTWPWERPGRPRSGQSSSPSPEAASPRPTAPSWPTWRPPGPCPAAARSGGSSLGARRSRPDSLLGTSKISYLVLALQTRFGFSHFYLRFLPGTKKKIQRRSESIEKITFKRVSTAAKKPRLYQPSNDNRAFRRVRGEASHRPSPETCTLATLLLLQPERTPPPPAEAPSQCWPTPLHRPARGHLMRGDHPPLLPGLLRRKAPLGDACLPDSGGLGKTSLHWAPAGLGSIPTRCRSPWR